MKFERDIAVAAVAQRGRNSATACCVLCGIRIVRYAALLWKQLKSDKHCCPAENDQRQEELLIPKKILCIGVPERLGCVDEMCWV